MTKPSKQPAKQPAKVPKNWPAHVTYLSTPLYAGISASQRRQLQTQPASGTPLAEVPPTLAFGPSAQVEIRRIAADAAHPARGQHGLFAARRLAPGAFVVPYWGAYHRGGAGRHVGSDYDLWLDRAADVAVDAARAGNEARFVNDFRGVPGAGGRANAEFREVWDPRRGERAMAVFAARGRSGGIAKGEEVLVSYGKGFWEVREQEARKKAPPEEGPREAEDDSPVAGAADALAALKIAGES